MNTFTSGDPTLAPSTQPHVALSAIEAAPPGDDAMEADRAIVAHLVTTQDDIANRSCRPGHLTGSACVVDPETGLMLVLFHAKLQRWLQPGGHADGDTNLAAVALREATEETGIDGLAVDPVPVDIDIHRVAPPDDTPHLHLDVRFLVVAPPRSTVRTNHESHGSQWVALSDLESLGADRSLIRMAESAFGRLGRDRT